MTCAGIPARMGGWPGRGSGQSWLRGAGRCEQLELDTWIFNTHPPCKRPHTPLAARHCRGGEERGITHTRTPLVRSRGCTGTPVALWPALCPPPMGGWGAANLCQWDSNLGERPYLPSQQSHTLSPTRDVGMVAFRNPLLLQKNCCPRGNGGAH
jgi:hypothetical protein